MKHLNTITLAKTIGILFLGSSILSATDYKWTSTTGGTWDTTSASWGGETWVNSTTASNAKFPSGSGGTDGQDIVITLGQNIEAFLLDMGGTYSSNVIIKSTGDYTLSLHSGFANNNTSKTLTIEAEVTGTSQSSGMKKTNAGIVVLANDNNTYVGNTSIWAGTLQLKTSSASQNNIKNSQEIRVDRYAYLDVSQVGNSSGFVVAENQSLIGVSNSTHAIDGGYGGTIIGDVTIGDKATLAGSLTFNNNLTLAKGSVTTIKLRDSGNLYDVIKGATSGTQTITFGGTLDIIFTNNFSTEITTALFTGFESFVGSFETINVTGLANGYVANFDATTGTITVAVAPIPEPATLASIFGGILLLVTLLRKRCSK